ncbi:MAG: DivIVA domain-containing protein [Actinobacteria bacterium]|jgi:cell division initiation protein|nr:MAG: DivIVA domain-containing protein [Actinomycetota bacterium]
MALTPVEIRHVKLGRGLTGYRRAATDRLLEEIVDSFEEVWRDRADLQDKTERLESDIARYRDLETLLRKTLVTAERSAAELREHARREADVVLAEARGEARKITQDAFAERERLRAEASRIRALLRSALEVTDEQDGEDEPAEAA